MASTSVSPQEPDAINSTSAVSPERSNAAIARPAPLCPGCHRVMHRAFCAACLSGGEVTRSASALPGLLHDHIHALLAEEPVGPASGDPHAQHGPLEDVDAPPLHASLVARAQAPVQQIMAQLHEPLGSKVARLHAARSAAQHARDQLATLDGEQTTRLRLLHTLQMRHAARRRLVQQLQQRRKAQVALIKALTLASNREHLVRRHCANLAQKQARAQQQLLGARTELDRTHLAWLRRLQAHIDALGQAPEHVPLLQPPPMPSPPPEPHTGPVERASTTVTAPDASVSPQPDPPATCRATAQETSLEPDLDHSRVLQSQHLAVTELNRRMQQAQHLRLAEIQPCTHSVTRLPQGYLSSSSGGEASHGSRAGAQLQVMCLSCVRVRLQTVRQLRVLALKELFLVRHETIAGLPLPADDDVLAALTRDAAAVLSALHALAAFCRALCQALNLSAACDVLSASALEQLAESAANAPWVKVSPARVTTTYTQLKHALATVFLQDGATLQLITTHGSRQSIIKSPLELIHQCTHPSTNLNLGAGLAAGVSLVDVIPSRWLGLDDFALED
ncbi:uncharacterized protein MONBRDRAFT_8629 [Monosiga brevicollis MX1]|uniref:Uncharacterized protein n=1 Tax=Monosiga brevicollis TaxID=81824 RepID=A9V0L9_MONBE|nr:uncharacterized protein MONBRDRAFT_8629 [Monosiga brevicollis MX1]EDQ89175.1 predicted protein [Monosiga brevicollis MX1]|eukprot:XP_001746280.1 hypothetical protein [Monosiga brevicollis MX1]